MMKFGELLEKFRMLKKISKKELAANSNLSPGYITLLTRGDRREPSKEVVNALADALELDLEKRKALFEAAGYVSYAETLTLDIDQILISQKGAWGTRRRTS